MIRLLLALLIGCQALGQEFVPFWADATAATGNNLVPDALAYWRFEETTNDAIDSSPNGRDLTENGTVGSTVNGVVANARSYADDDETDYFSRASEAVFGFTGDFTITVWAQLDNGPPAVDDKAIISRGDFGGANFSWLLLFDNASPDDLFQFYWSTDGTFNAGNVVSFALDGDASEASYYFVVVRRTGSTLHISATFLGDPLATDTTGSAGGTYFNDGTNELRVGDLEGSDIHDMRGNIDELGVWSRYLSDCEVGWLYSARAGVFTWPNFDSNTCVP